MAKEYKVSSHPDLVKRGGVVVNVDREAYLSYMAKREKEATDAAQMEDLKSQVAELKAMVELLVKGK